MTVTVVNVDVDDLVRDRRGLLESLHLTESGLRERVDNETATRAERTALDRLEEIAFLLGEDT